MTIALERPDVERRFIAHVRKWLAEHKGVPKIRSIVNATGSELELQVMAPIGSSFWFDGVTAADVKYQMDRAPNAQTIRVLMDSPGGDVFEGQTIQALLKRSPATVHVEVLGEASSAASVIAMAGDTIAMHEGSMMMIHRAATTSSGFSDQLRADADVLDKVTSNIIDLYVARTKQPRADIEQMVQAETWMTPTEAVAKGFCDSVIAAKQKPTAPACKNANGAREAAVAAAKAAQTLGYTIDWTALSDAFELDAPLNAADIDNKVVPYHEYPKHDDSSWDGSAAEQRMRHWASSDGSGDAHTIDWTKYRNGFAWYDQGASNTFGAYKLPHHDVVNGELVTSRSGTIAAGDAVSGSRGGTNIPAGDLPGVREHLQKHYAQFGLKAPWESQTSNRARVAPTNLSRACAR